MISVPPFNVSDISVMSYQAMLILCQRTVFLYVFLPYELSCCICSSSHLLYPHFTLSSDIFYISLLLTSYPITLSFNTLQHSFQRYIPQFPHCVVSLRAFNMSNPSTLIIILLPQKTVLSYITYRFVSNKSPSL